MTSNEIDLEKEDQQCETAKSTFTVIYVLSLTSSSLPSSLFSLFLFFLLLVVLSSWQKTGGVGKRAFKGHDVLELEHVVFDECGLDLLVGPWNKQLVVVVGLFRQARRKVNRRLNVVALPLVVVIRGINVCLLFLNFRLVRQRLLHPICFFFSTPYLFFLLLLIFLHIIFFFFFFFFFSVFLTSRSRGGCTALGRARAQRRGWAPCRRARRSRAPSLGSFARDSASNRGWWSRTSTL